MLFIIGAVIIGVLLFGTEKGKSILKKGIFSFAAVVIGLFLISLLILSIPDVLGWVFNNIVLIIFIAAILIGALIALYVYWESKEKKLHAAKVAEWLAAEPKTFNDVQILQMLGPVTARIAESDGNDAKTTEELPFGRITYFLNFFHHDLEDEEPLFFSPRRSMNRDEIREYGTVITTAGVYVAAQTTKTDKSGNLIVKAVFMPFLGVVFTELTEDSLTVYYEKFENKRTISKTDTTVSLKLLSDCFSLVSGSGISRALRDSTVIDYNAAADEKEEEFLRNNASEGAAAALTTVGTAATIPQMNDVFSEVGYTMNERQGHGSAAEYANTAIDRFTGDFRAKHMGGDNEQNGPDRSTHRLFQSETKIQSKYYNDPNAIIRSAFDEHDYSLDTKIEVPRDKYEDCVLKLQKKIDEGAYEGKGIAKGDDARKYLKKGAVTYKQSINIATAASATAASAESCGVGGDLTSDLSATLDFKELRSDLIFMC